MKFDFETQDFINTLQEMLQDYGRMALTDGRKCYSLWLDYAPQLPEEGELLKAFLELGLGKQVVELKHCSTVERTEWRKQSIVNMVRMGETENDATSLVDAVLAALGLSVKQKEKNEKKTDNEQLEDKKITQHLDKSKWRHIVSTYMPKAFPGENKVEFDDLQVPEDMMTMLKKYLGSNGCYSYKYLAYGRESWIWVILTDIAIIVHSPVVDDFFFVASYEQIQLELSEDCVTFIHDDGRKQDIVMEMNGCYLVAMLRLMQGQVGDEIITRDEWKKFLLFWGSEDCTAARNCYYTATNQLSPQLYKYFRDWMNSGDVGFREDEVLVIVDERDINAFGKKFNVITDNALCYKEMFGKTKSYYTDIVDVVDDGYFVKLILKNKDIVFIWHEGKREFFVEILRAIIFIKQNNLK